MGQTRLWSSDDEAAVSNVTTVEKQAWFIITRLLGLLQEVQTDPTPLASGGPAGQEKAR